jgi:NADH-quinone oxidoreductase subunit M
LVGGDEMMESAPLLLVLVPLAGALAVAAMPAATARVWAMGAMLVVLLLSWQIFVAFGDPGGTRPADFDMPWMPSLGIDLHLGVDGVSLYFVFLAALLFPIVLASTWNEPRARRPLYLALMLVLQASLLGTFLAQNLVLFFAFWEAVLIPAGLLVLVFGGAERRRAAMAFFLYTLAGSVLLLAAVIVLGAQSLRQTGNWSFELGVVSRLDLGWGTQLFVFVAIMLACAVKCPIVPFHSWLPLAYCEAPPSVTALMAGALSKMGAFGILKLAIPLAPAVAVAAGPSMAALAVVSILYGAVLALREPDYKRLVAYSSLSHMGYIVLGFFAFQPTAVQGSLLQVLSHGVAVTGLFLLIGKLQPPGDVSQPCVRGLAATAPRFAVVMMLFVLTSVALPLTSGFTAEFLILLGAFTQGLRDMERGSGTLMLASAVLASTGMVLGATYMLRFARVAVFGGTTGERTPWTDLRLGDTAPFAVLLAVVLWVGVAPASLMERVQDVASRMPKVALAPAWPEMPARAALAASRSEHAR